MRLDKIIETLKADRDRLQKKYESLGIKAKDVEGDIKGWAAIHCHGVLTGYKFYLNRIEALIREKKK